MHSEILSLAILDEIAERLSHIEEMQRSQIPDGVILPITQTIVGDEIVTVGTLLPWISVTIYNDGPDDVFSAINNQAEYLELNINDQRTVDMKTHKISRLNFYCRVGETATVRIDTKR